jgi:hypothetical protein
LQTFFASPRVDTITYSQFKVLAKKGLLSNVVIGEKGDSRRNKVGARPGSFSARRRSMLLASSGKARGMEYSEETARIVDEEIKRVLTDAHQKVRDCLSSRRDALEELAQLLLEKEVVERPALQRILNGQMTKEVRDSLKQGPSDSNGAPIEKPV